MDVLTAAYRAANEPSPEGDQQISSEHCARCGQSASDGPRTADTISKVFTAFEGWVDPTSDTICARCAWAFQTPDLRRHAHMVTRSGLVQLTRSGLCRHLTRGPVGSSTAFVVPLRPGRKHLMAEAAWSKITTDQAALSWTLDDSRRLQIMQTLRALGFGSRMLAAPAPAHSILARLAVEQRIEVLGQWALLAPWRHRRPWLALGIHATTPTQEA